MPRHRSALVFSVLLLTAGCASSSPSTASVAPASEPLAPSAAATSVPSTVATAFPTPAAPQSPAPVPSPGGPVDPAQFGGPVDNPWFPLIPGTIFTNTGTKDGKKAVDVFEVTNSTKVLAGVTCVVVRDRLTLDGMLEERTLDYYAQDLAGNVWYFGEDTAELDRSGKVLNTDGSWHAGVDGAGPGVYMEATPMAGREFPQEVYPGQAEDHFRVTDRSASVVVQFGSFTDVLVTEEWTPLEPGVLDNKFYVRGIGQVREVTVKGPNEELSLKTLKRP
jgi:hypothetical protein